MRHGYILLGLGVVSMIAGGAGAEQFVETFDGGSNEGGWTWGAGDTIQSSGGNPGFYLATFGLDTFAPQPRTTAADSVFQGNYREAGVTSIGIDLIQMNNATTAGRPLTLMLVHDNGTPGVFGDDTAAYFMGPNIPSFGAGWVSYDFDVPAADNGLPTGWQLLNLGDSGAPANHTWDQVVQDVSRLQFFYGDPTFFFIFQLWQVGMDNVRITFEDEGVPGDVNGDGVVNVEDMVEVILAWGNCPFMLPCPADLNGDDRVNVEDLVTVILNWS